MSLSPIVRFELSYPGQAALPSAAPVPVNSSIEDKIVSPGRGKPDSGGAAPASSEAATDPSPACVRSGVEVVLECQSALPLQLIVRHGEEGWALLVERHYRTSVCGPSGRPAYRSSAKPPGAAGGKSGLGRHGAGEASGAGFPKEGGQGGGAVCRGRATAGMRVQTIHARGLIRGTHTSSLRKVTGVKGLAARPRRAQNDGAEATGHTAAHIFSFVPAA